MTKISVISVTFNNCNGLRDTLNSIARLDVSPLEIIIIDACSTDSTFEVVQEYKKVLNIIYVCEVDDGIYDGMNKGG
jgi:glycosyltransferase involved in cell wall biosynthesis